MPADTKFNLIWKGGTVALRGIVFDIYNNVVLIIATVSAHVNSKSSASLDIQTLSLEAFNIIPSHKLTFQPIKLKPEIILVTASTAFSCNYQFLCNCTLGIGRMISSPS